MTLRRFARCGLLALGAVAMLALSPAWGAGVTIAIPKVTGPAGEEVKVPILVRGAQGIGAMQLDVLYDPGVLSPTSVETRGMLAGLVEHNVVKPGRLRIALATNKAVNGDGEILSATFKVLGGSESALGLDHARAWALADSLDVAVTTEAGHFTVNSHKTLIVIGIVALAGVLALSLVIARLRRKGRPSPPPATGA